MTVDPAGLSASASDPVTALTELSEAVGRAAIALAAAPATDDETAYRYFRVLDPALNQLAALLQAVPGIVNLADAGPLLTSRVNAAVTQLGAERTQIEAARQALLSLQELQSEIRDSAAEHANLCAWIDELELARQSSEEIPGLRERLTELESAVSGAAAADAGELTARMAAAAQQLRALTDRQREVLGAQVAKLIAEADAAALELEDLTRLAAATSADLAARKEQADLLKAEQEQHLPALAARRQADADLAAGLLSASLPGGGVALEQVRSALDDLGRQLNRLEDQLRPLLAEHARASADARNARHLSGGG
jgi:hypothetical protein